MTIIPGLTSTRKENMPAFIEALARTGLDRVALFPTCLDPAERAGLYRELERLPGLGCPHVHLRSDTDTAELAYLSGRFGTEAFNIHPAASAHPLPRLPAEFARRIFIENVIELPEPGELAAVGGLCPDYAHWENARLLGLNDHDGRMRRLAARWPIGCCHISAIRVGAPNAWAGGWDHHAFSSLADFDYLVRYRDFLPPRWASLELENSLEEQLEAVRHITALLAE
jgi:hypothetical protein